MYSNAQVLGIFLFVFLVHVCLLMMHSLFLTVAFVWLLILCNKLAAVVCIKLCLTLAVGVCGLMVLLSLVVVVVYNFEYGVIAY
jgi:hypothetical protein